MEIRHLIKVCDKYIEKKFDCDIDLPFLIELGFNPNQTRIRDDGKITTQYLLGSLIMLKLVSKKGDEYYVFYPIEGGGNEFPITKKQQLLKLIDIYVDKE